MNDFSLSPIFCAHNGVAILEQNEENLVIGMVNPDDAELRRKIENRYFQCSQQGDIIENCAVDNNLARKKKCSEYLEYRTISKDFCIKETSRRFALRVPQLFSSSLEKTSIVANATEQNLEYIIQDAPIIHLLNSLLLECAEKGGSDIHIEPFNDGSRVRMRVLGDLELYSVVDKKMAAALILRILFLSQLDIAEQRRPQDGSFHFEAGSIQTEVRVSVLPCNSGRSAVLRLLHCKNFTLKLDSLGFASRHKDFLENVCTKKNALVLVCGATGAGKSTTLAAILHELALQQRKIITIEDPVEYQLEGVVQVPVHPEVDMDFSQVLRRVFRHDPDIIMIGEIRDSETAHTAVRAALTGHLVLASLHTADAPSATIRLLDMGIENWLLASVFGGVICQKLIKKMTPEGAKLSPIAEVLPSCADVSDLILRKATLTEFRNWMKKHKIISMDKEEGNE